MANDAAVSKLRNAIYSRQRTVLLERCSVGSFQNIFDSVVNADPRVVIYIELEKLQYTYNKKSVISLSEDYSVSIEYNPKFTSINEIILYNGSQKATDIVVNRKRDEICVVGSRVDDFISELDNIYSKYVETVEGFQQLYWETMTYNQYTIVNLYVKFSMEQMQLQSVQKKTAYEIKRIVSNMKNSPRIPIFLKVFLAFSYVTQNTSLNRAAESEKLQIGQKTAYPNAKLAYGVLNDHSASSLGISWMMKYLLDEMGIENLIVAGRINDSFLNSDNYFWNMVNIDGMYYHIDATWNIDMNGIFVGGFMKDDNFMLGSHMWYDYFPNAKGTRFDYDYVEDYLIENGEDLLDMGIPEELLFPEPVNDF